jgi:UDP-N-acetylglucosamine diphosphorylase / glucose-1-phosphate thymidylyltransferase / UDP-N-acetylgalactosamine diphosphorylase / glucosamine-1-phosphate N-acetyltransferase / galactosamine-1-phosphate N-acetyltransferase
MVSRETNLTSHYFDLSGLWFVEIFSASENVWGVLAPKLKEEWIRKRLKGNVSGVPREGSLVTRTTTVKASGGTAVVEAGSYLLGDEIELRKGTVIEAGAWVTGPTILGEGTAVRHGAYIRGGVATGTECVIGHTSEVKSSLFLNGAKAPHFAYVGDAILGANVNLGAGTKISNLKITNDEVVVRFGEEKVKTGLRKMGAILGDGVQTGCNSVLNPGALLGKNCLVYPGISVRNGYYAPRSILKE